MDPDKFLSVKVDSQLNVIYSLRCSLAWILLCDKGEFLHFFLVLT